MFFNIAYFGIPLLDYIALLWFIFCAVFYVFIADFGKRRQRSLVKVMHKYRIQWMRQMLRRSERLADIRIIGNLLQSTTFFASTSIIIIAGVFAVFGYGERAMQLMVKIPFVGSVSMLMWTVKTSLLLIIFIFAFFKFTWVLRQFNYASVLLAAVPFYKEGSKLKEVKKAIKYTQKTAELLSNAARHFNIGIRAYYFALAVLAWYIGAVYFILATTLVVIVLHRREFVSKTLSLLLRS